MYTMRSGDHRFISYSGGDNSCPKCSAGHPSVWLSQVGVTGNPHPAPPAAERTYPKQALELRASTCDDESHGCSL